MLYREIIAVCSQIHTKPINTPCGQNVELLDVKPGGNYNDHWALKGSYDFYRVFQAKLDTPHFKHSFSFYTRNSSNNYAPM